MRQPAIEPEIRRQLDRIVSSRDFYRSGRLVRLLRFIVESALRNDVAGLKESVLGREVYDRGRDFDGRIDPIVRTEVRRLRRKLADYYQRDGRLDSLLISVPKGSYLPVFQLRDGYGRGWIAGQAIGPYCVLEKLAEGPNGTTYRVRRDGLAREFALKLLPSDVAANRTLLSYLDEEVGLAAGVNHENICAAQAVERWNGHECIVSDFHEGISLEDWLLSGQQTSEECLNIARQLLSGLAAAHRSSLIHGHLKPSNILLTNRGPSEGFLVKILNFGTRSLAGRTRLLADGCAQGTMVYSPENEMDDGHSDVWSAGVILYELLTGSLPSVPIQGDWSSIPWRVDMPKEYRLHLTALLGRCLAENREERFASGIQLNDAFAALVTSAASPRNRLWPWRLGGLAGPRLCRARGSRAIAAGDSTAQG